MRYLIKSESIFGTTYYGTGETKVSIKYKPLTESRIKFYGFKTLDGAEKARENMSKWLTEPRFKLSVVPFPV